MESDGVRGIGAVGPDSFGESRGKLGKRALSGGRRFSPIKASGKHKRVDNLNLALTRPRSMAKSVAQLSSLGQALVDSGAT